MRTVAEWQGKNDDSPVPPRVKVRVRDSFFGKCAICGFPAIKPVFDHIIALCNGGKNCESNLQPVCRPCHAEKTKDDVAIKAKVARLAKKDMGIRKRRSFTQWRNMRGQIVTAPRDR